MLWSASDTLVSSGREEILEGIGGLVSIDAVTKGVPWRSGSLGRVLWQVRQEGGERGVRKEGKKRALERAIMHAEKEGDSTTLLPRRAESLNTKQRLCYNVRRSERGRCRERCRERKEGEEKVGGVATMQSPACHMTRDIKNVANVMFTYESSIQTSFRQMCEWI